MSKNVVRIGWRGKAVEAACVAGQGGRQANLLELNTRVELIQAWIPIGLEAVNEVLQQKACQLAGARYSREGGGWCDTVARRHVRDVIRMLDWDRLREPIWAAARA